MSKLNIKEEMRSIDQKDRGWYDTLSDEEKKKIGLWLLMRYTSNATGEDAEHYLEWTNEAVNVHFNTIRKHPQLQYLLMQLVGVGSTTYHPWLQPGKAQKKNKLQTWLTVQYPHLNDDEIDIMISSGPEPLKALLREHGLKDKEIKDLIGKLK